jgi:type II secretory pathway component PulL
LGYPSISELGIHPTKAAGVAPRMWLASVAVALALLILIAVVLTWRYGHGCNAWEAKVRQQTEDMFNPAFADVYTRAEIESLARRALDHERPEGC